MIKNSTLLLSMLLLSIGVSAQNTWIQRDSVKGPTRANCAAFMLVDDGYLIAGYNGFSKKRSVYSYDIDQDDWDQELSLGGLAGDGLNRTSAVGFNANGYGFVGLGEGNGFMFKDLWKYDRYTDTWTQMADYGGEARTQAVSFVVGNIAYVGTGKGSDFATLLNDFYAYDSETNTWTQISDFPGTPRLDAVGVSMVGKGYVTLGYDGTSFPNDFYEYDPSTDTWDSKASFPGTPRINAVGFGVFPSLFISTGDDGFNYLNDTWEYNYFGDIWIQRADFPGAPRSGASAFVIEDRPFVGTGFGDGTYYDDFYEYTVVLSTEEPLQINANLFPNPANNQFQLNTESTLNLEEIRIFSLDGKNMTDQFSIEQNSDSEFTFTFDALSVGTYYVTVTRDGEMLLNKPVIII